MQQWAFVFIKKNIWQAFNIYIQRKFDVGRTRQQYKNHFFFKADVTYVVVQNYWTNKIINEKKSLQSLFSKIKCQKTHV